VASGAHAHDAEGIALGPRQADIDPLVRTLPSQANHLVFVDDAGPCGDWL
jgi:hypothetical protein